MQWYRRFVENLRVSNIESQQGCDFLLWEIVVKMSFVGVIGDLLLGCGYKLYTLPETDSSYPKHECLRILVSFWVSAYFQRRTVSFREGNVM